MNKPRLLKKSIPLWVFLVVVALCASSIFAAIIFTTPKVTNTMSLGAVNNLELYSSTVMGGGGAPTSWTLVPVGGTTYDYGSFAHDDSVWHWVKIKNVGNVVASVSWAKTEWTEENGKWGFAVQADGTDLAEGATKTLAVGAEMTCQLTVHEISATPGVTYSFGVLFNNNSP